MLVRMSFTITISIFLAGLICFFMFGCAETNPLLASLSEEVNLTLTTQGRGTKLSKPEVQILQVGYFHSDEVSAKSGEVWLGMYPTKDGYELIPSTINVEAAHDPIVDDNEDQKTGKKVSVNLPTSPLFLVKGMNTLKRGGVKTLSSGLEIVLTPGKSLSFRLNKDVYHLTVLGDGDISSGFQNYKIELSKGQLRQVIVAYSSTNDAVPRLLWAGDLDRDGQLDLFIDATNHYVLSAPALFLSSMAEGGHLLEKVAQLMTSC